MSRLNEYKKATVEDKFFRHFVCLKVNHNELWAYLKRKNRRDYRKFLKKDLTKQLDMI